MSCDGEYDDYYHINVDILGNKVLFPSTEDIYADYEILEVEREEEEWNVDDLDLHLQPLCDVILDDEEDFDYKSETTGSNTLLHTTQSKNNGCRGVRFAEGPQISDYDHSRCNHNHGGGNNKRKRSSHYGNALTANQLTDSMESFMSAMSSATSNVSEFSDELTPTRLQIYLRYISKSWTLRVGVHQAECPIIGDKDDKVYWQVHITLLPFKKHRLKTKYKSTSTPIFNQTFDIDDVAKQALSQMGVRYRIYGRVGRTGRKKLAGEVEMELGCLVYKQDNELQEWKLLRKQNRCCKDN